MTPEYPQPQNVIEVSPKLIDTTAKRTCQIIRDVIIATRQDNYEHAALVGWTFDATGKSVTGTIESGVIKGELDHIPSALLLNSRVREEGLPSVNIHSHPNTRQDESRKDVKWLAQSAPLLSTFTTPTFEIHGPMPTSIIASPQEDGVFIVHIISQVRGKEKIDTRILEAAHNNNPDAQGVRMARKILSTLTINPVEIGNSGLAMAQFEIIKPRDMKEVENYLKKALPSRYTRSATPPTFKPDLSFLR